MLSLNSALREVKTKNMSRNVTILVIILVILLIAGYLLWLRGRFPTTQTVPAPPAVVGPSPTLAPIATNSATASVSASPKVSPSTSLRTSPTVTKTSTSSGKTVK